MIDPQVRKMEVKKEGEVGIEGRCNGGMGKAEAGRQRQAGTDRTRRVTAR